MRLGTRIKLGECNCFSFSEQTPHLCWKDRMIYLTSPKKYFKEMEELTESAINHEVIHLTVASIEDKEVSKKFDYMFDYKQDLITRPDGTPNEEVK